jgi:hypothetical protein
VRSTEYILVRVCSLAVFFPKTVVKAVFFVSDKPDVFSKTFWGTQTRISINIAPKVTKLETVASLSRI